MSRDEREVDAILDRVDHTEFVSEPLNRISLRHSGYYVG